ncbi:MAG TPA: hypothetical protein VIO61_06865 [Anaerolineaceae bacterium]
MKRLRGVPVFLALLAFLSLACSNLPQIALFASPTPTIDAPATAAAVKATEAMALTQAAAAQATTAAQAKATADAQATQRARSTADAATLAAASTAQARTALAESSQKTSVAATLARSQTAQAQATSQAATASAPSATMVKLMNTLYGNKLLKSVDGKYTRLENFEQSVAKIGYLTWWRTGQSPSNFVLTADTAWESAYNLADWFNSGCGFVFRENTASNIYFIYLGLDGNVYLRGYINGNFYNIASGYYGKVEYMKGTAQVGLAVADPYIIYYVNGKEVIRRQENRLKSGNLAYTVFSGTNYDYGTRCKITNVELYTLTGY